MFWFEFLHFFFLAALIILGMLFIRCAIRADWLSKKLERSEHTENRNWPQVTVQIPIRNELNVIERVLRSTAKLNYPSDRLEIQVLDDSDDATCNHIDRVVQELRKEGGLKIEVIRRMNKAGFKAGAMANGLVHARGEFIAIFDSDCIPETNFLKKVIPHFERDSRIGLVQGRWSFLNREHSWLTRTQAIILDSLMMVEQPVSFAKRSPFQFNGSGGVWRRSCIENSGGWSAVSVAEDLELSFRALLGGWRFVHLSNVLVDTELPEILSSYRLQQKRWTCGAAQVLRELFLPILTSGRPVGDVSAMFMHLGRRAIFPLLSIITVLAPLIAFEWIPVSVPFGLFFNLAVWSFFAGGFLVTLIQGHRLLGKGVWEVLLLYPLTIGIFIGLSFTCSASFIFGLIVRNTPFIRTPKKGDGKLSHFYRVEFDSFSLPELMIGLAYSFFTYLAIKQGMKFEPLLFCYFALSYLAVGGSAVYASLYSFCVPHLENISKVLKQPGFSSYTPNSERDLGLSGDLGLGLSGKI